MIPEREREALMRLTMCAREECRICMYQKRCDFDFQCKLATKNMNILADALRKTENSSEIPNNSTSSKMEQVDKDINVRSKDEPQYDFGEYADRLWKIAYERGKREALEQTEPSCDTCKLKGTTEWCKRQEVCRAYKRKEEPQTEREDE